MLHRNLSTKIVLRVFPPKKIDWILDEKWNIKYPIFEHEQDNLIDVSYFVSWENIYFVCKYFIQN